MDEKETNTCSVNKGEERIVQNLGDEIGNRLNLGFLDKMKICKVNQNKNKDQQNKNQNQNQNQQQQPQQSKISRQNAEQMLQALENNEKKIQDKVKKVQAMKAQSKRVEKDW